MTRTKCGGGIWQKIPPAASYRGMRESILHFSQRNGDAGGAAGVIERKLDIGGERLAAGQLLDVGQPHGDIFVFAGQTQPHLREK